LKFPIISVATIALSHFTWSAALIDKEVRRYM